MFKNINNESGLVRLIIIIIIGIIVLSYFGFNLQDIIESPQTQGNIGYVWGGVVYVWNTYLAGPVLWFWNDIFIDLLWSSFIDNITAIRNGGSGGFVDNAPGVL